MERLVRRLLPALATGLVWLLVASLGGLVHSTTRNAEPHPPGTDTTVTEDASAHSAGSAQSLESQHAGSQTPDNHSTSSRAAEGAAERVAGGTTPGSALRLRTCLVPEALVWDTDGELSVAVSALGDDSSEGPLLLGINEDQPVAPASVVKLFTAVAALEVLGPDFRFHTRVRAGETPGDVWLIGGGDVTLTRAAGANYYDSESHLERLAASAVATAEGVTIQRVWVDDSRYARFPDWDESWRPGSAALGYVAPITALQVDGDRDQPAVRLSPRSTDPTSRATQWFLDAVERTGQARPEIVESGSASGLVSASGLARAPEGRLLAEVSSAPLSQLVQIMLIDSDNSLAEVIAREVALALDPTGELGISPGEAILRAVEGVFRRSAGVSDDSLEGAVIHDGSGLSPLSGLSPQAVVSLLWLVEHTAQWKQVESSLPVSGQSGSLRQRYRVVASEMQGLVRAKTGSIRGTRSLAGYLETPPVQPEDAPEDEVSAGERLAFSIVLSGNQVSNASRDDIDRLVAALAQCGENLADWNDPNN
ncbi:D-alanyl-D-alanine carboxypeptidase [Pontimonas sp.]|uniref:D-alanyl-D-alanine carboxypeptidase/D-alanyl-D-alanine-endopeptidase n=1 Tax=Pontimonas sp. TaxID=2304492 RepID=UPI00286FC82D|nr:D-alanyl-D-alanine carboxypeptidase [Pontimonas sp.]MDR9434861.1 D-alanyl-D-alanine carboxypeptidase [Pontimonas sp.]